MGKTHLTTSMKCTRRVNTEQPSSSEEESDSTEYESEDDLQEAPVYYSDQSEDDLKFNVWQDNKLPIQEGDVTVTINELISKDKMDDHPNPAAFLAQVALAEELKPLNLGPLTDH